MKKLFCIIGAIVTAVAVFAAIAIILKKIKVKVLIERAEGEDEACCPECCAEEDEGFEEVPVNDNIVVEDEEPAEEAEEDESKPE